MITSRRSALKAGLTIGAAAALPRFAIAQSDTRPTIRIAVQQISTTNTLEPLREQSNVGYRIAPSYLECLIEKDLQRELQEIPGLATKWSRIDDRTIEFTLRQGVKFHNGDELTAEDVAFSFGKERMFGSGAPPSAGNTKDVPAEAVAVSQRFWGDFEKIEVLGKHRLRFVVKAPDVTLEARIGRSGSEIISRRGFSEAKTWLDWARRPIGTGPYRVVDLRPDVSLTMEAHDDYWGGRPPIKQIRYIVVPEVSSRINGLFSGEYDFACDIPPDHVEEIVRNKRFDIAGGLVTNHRILCFNKDHPELKDPRVRRAMCHAIDRQLIVDSIWGGRTRVPKGLQWEFYGQMYLPDWNVPTYDKAVARRLLKEAGYKGGAIPYRVLNNYYPNQVATAQAMVEMWREVGLNVEIVMKENFAQVHERTPVRGVRDWSNSALYNDPVSSLVNQHGPRGAQQMNAEWSNAEFNTLCTELETSTDRARRKAVFRRMLEIVEREDPGYTVLHQTAIFTAKRADIGWKASPSFAMDFRASNFKAARA